MEMEMQSEIEVQMEKAYEIEVEMLEETVIEELRLMFKVIKVVLGMKLL